MTHSEAVSIVRTLQDSGHAAYFAGGCVRDFLLGRVAKDFDIATDATPDQVMRIFPRTTGLEGKCFGVVRVLQGEGTYEVATFRQDLEYKDGRRPEGVRFVTAEEDARRRDFTVNGLFHDPVSGEIKDFVGGQADLKARVIRAIGTPADRFGEDHLRLLRAVRFAVNLDFEIEPVTWAAVRDHAALIQKIAPERIREELDKIWTGLNPARGLDLLDASGLLREILPEISAMHGVEQPPQFHPEGDVFKHTRLMLADLKHAPLELALSVLLHDVGKPRTQTTDATGRIRFNEHESVGARMAERILMRLRYSNQVIADVCACVQNHMAFKDVPKMKLSTLKRMMSRPTYPTERELHRIDCSSSHRDLGIYETLLLKEKEFGAEQIDPPRLVSGHELMALGVPKGKEIGWMLEQLRDAQLEGRVTDAEGALKLAAELWERKSKG